MVTDSPKIDHWLTCTLACLLLSCILHSGSRDHDTRWSVSLSVISRPGTHSAAPRQFKIPTWCPDILKCIKKWTSGKSSCNSQDGRKWYSHLSIYFGGNSGLRIPWGASSNEDAGDCWLAQNNPAVVTEAHGRGTISSGGEHKPICKQEERSKEQLRSRKKGRKWRYNGFVRAESENWKRLSYWQWWEVRVVEQVKRGWQKPEVCSCREQQTNDKKGQKDKEWDKGWWWGR